MMQFDLGKFLPCMPILNYNHRHKHKWQPTPVFLPGKIPWMEEPGRLQSMGSQRVRHD